MVDEEVGLKLSLKNRRETERGIHGVGDELNRTGDQAERVGKKARYGAAGLLTLSKSGRVAGRAVLYGTGAMAAGVVGLGVVTAKFTKDAVKGWEDHTKVVRQSRAVIKSTGGAANLTARQVGGLSDALERKTGVDGDVIQSGANMLLTFKNVRNEQGAGNKIFSRSLAVLNDMSVAMGSDASKSAIQLGKALNDPVKGVTALAKVGVTFTDGQKEQIKNYVEQGRMAKAQKIILRELTSEFAGSAKAQMTTGDQVMVGYHALQDTIGKAVIPLQQKFNRFLINDALPAAQRYAEVFEKRGVPAIEKYAGIFERRGIPAIKEFVDEARPLAESIFPAIGSAAGTTADAFKVIAPRAKAVFDGFNNLPDWAKSAIAITVGAGVVAKKTGAFSLGKSVLGGITASKPMPVYVVNNSPIGEAGGPGGYKKYLAGAVVEVAIAAIGTKLAVDSQGKNGVPGVVNAGASGSGVTPGKNINALTTGSKSDWDFTKGWKLPSGFGHLPWSSKDVDKVAASTDTLNKKTILFLDTLRGIDRTWRPSIFVDGLDPALDKVNNLRTSLLGLPSIGSYGNGLGVLAPTTAPRKRPKNGGGLSFPSTTPAPPLTDDPFSRTAGATVHNHFYVDGQEVTTSVMNRLETAGARG